VPSNPQSDYLRAYELAWNAGQFEMLERLASPGYRRRSYRGAAMTLQELESSVTAVRDGFPDLRTDVEDVLTDGNRVVLRWSSSGTHLGHYLGASPTGKDVVVSGVTIARFEAGALIEEWVTWDARDILTAVGVSTVGRNPANGMTAQVEDRLLRDVHRKFVTGVTVVTTLDDTTPRGLVVNAFVSVSLNPALICVCIARASATHEVLMRAQAFAVNILGVGQEQIARNFASSRSDKFAGVPWEPGPLGSPVLFGNAGFFEARISERVQASSHTMFIGHVAAAASQSAPPLVYMAGVLHDSTTLRALPSES
jgi:flavin reductase (DIM6/NTAB) family NADH-FMN oxidoreductase RutF/predicted ester cyclase